MFQKSLHRRAVTVRNKLLAVVEQIFRLFVFRKVNEILTLDLNTFAHQFYSPQALTGQNHGWLELTIVCVHICACVHVCACACKCD
jgi:hypothetical protein